MLLMMIKDIAGKLADFFYWTFEILPALGNGPNLIFSLIIFALFLYWLKRLKDYRKEAKATGNYKYE